MSYIGKKNGNPNTDFLEAGGELENHDLVNVDSSGNVGIGTSSPSQKLETTGNIFINTSGNPNLEIKTSGAGNNPYLRFKADTNYWDAQATFSNSGNDLFLMYNGSVKVGFPSAGGITFNGDTASANALDDYEEGTWTPTFHASSTDFTSITYSTTQHFGFYTKVGRVVHITMYTRTDALSGGSGWVYIDGLPFTKGSTGKSGGGAGGYHQNWGTSEAIMGSTLSGTRVYLTKNGKNTTAIVPSDMNTGNDSNQLLLSFSYFID